MVGDDIELETIERWALAYLGRYASSAENLRRVLLRRVRRRLTSNGDHLPQAVAAIAALVARYQASGLLDDVAYAAGQARSLNRRGAPSRQIRARLVAKGVAPVLAADAVADLDAEAGDLDLAAACAFARRRRLGPYRQGAAVPAHELGAFARAGFSRQVAEKLLACADVAAAEALARGARD
jgi:regulatory protein